MFVSLPIEQKRPLRRRSNRMQEYKSKSQITVKIQPHLRLSDGIFYMQPRKESVHASVPIICFPRPVMLLLCALKMHMHMQRHAAFTLLRTSATITFVMISLFTTVANAEFVLGA